VTIMGAVRPAVAVALVLAVAGCAEGGAGGGPVIEPVGPPAATLPDGDAALVLQVRYVGGFMTPESTTAQLPLASVYADGRVIVTGPVAAIYPPFAWPNLRVRDIGRDGVEELVARALDAGVAETTDLGMPPVADAPATRFTLVTGSDTYVREAYALFETTTTDEATGGGDSGLTADQRAAREELLDLATSLGDLATGQGGEQPPPAYESDAVAAVVRPWTPSDDDVGQGLVPQPAPWPGPALPGEPLGPLPGLTCVTATGEEGRAVVDAAQAATMLTPWLAADGSRWSVTFRPLLPHESGCADLAG
jgi:hypothetical protein